MRGTALIQNKSTVIEDTVVKRYCKTSVLSGMNGQTGGQTD